MQLLNLINYTELVVPMGTVIELIKIKGDVVITTYRNISVNNST